MIMCNIYSPNKGDPHLFHKVNTILGEMEGQVILAGDFNEVMDAFLDKSKCNTYAQGRYRTGRYMAIS